MDGDKNQKWMELLREYMIANHINHTFWCLNTNSGDTGGLWAGFAFDQTTSKTTITWEEDKYALFEPSLWQTQETGKFIGLDHEKALGNNGTGLSLSEFYASYASTEGSNLDGGTVIGSDYTKPTTEPTKPTTTTTTQTTTTTSLPDETLCGDVDGDKKVGVLDLVLLNRHLLRMPIIDIVYYFENADVNADGVLNVVDAILYRRYLLGEITTFPAES